MSTKRSHVRMLLAGAAFVLTVTMVPLVATVATAQTLPVQEVKADLIPRDAIFGNPSRTAASLSPDGKHIAFLAPKDGVLNIWIAPTGKMDAAKAVTEEKGRPIRSLVWSADSRRILYIQDKGGNENWRLYGVELASGKTTEYTPFEKAQARIVGQSPKHPNEILVGLNNRNPRFHDVHRLNLDTGELTLVRQNDSHAGFLADWDLTLRVAQRQTPDGGFVLEKINADGSLAPFGTIPQDDNLTTSVAGFTADGKTMYMRDSRNRDTAALTAVDMATGAETVIATDAKADLGGTLRNPTTGVVEAYNVNYLKNEWYPVGDTLKADIAFLNDAAKGEWSVISRTRDDALWTVAIDRVSEPTANYLYDRAARKLTKLFTTRPELENRTLAAMHPVEIESRDGLTLPSYLTLPPGSDVDGDGRPEKPVPLVLNVHGGPWARDGFGFNAEHQWLANRGYAVLAVNYRGSTGFGKNFINAANMQFGAKMHDDLIDAVGWAVKQGVTQADTVAIYGGSYGGYATLTGLTSTPDVFACGVNIVGPSNLVTLIESFPEYWKPILEGTWYRRVGDPRDPEGRAFLMSRSPITKVHEIRKPLLVAHGANDPRVRQAESDQLVKAMQERNIPVTYAIYADEGHGFARPQNRTSFYAITEAFLSRCLGGRFEPVGDDFKGASVTVPVGDGYVPGLADALKAGR